MSAANDTKTKTFPQTIAPIYNGVIASGNVAVYIWRETGGVKSESVVREHGSTGAHQLAASFCHEPVVQAFKPASDSSESVDLLQSATSNRSESVDSRQLAASNWSESVVPTFESSSNRSESIDLHRNAAANWQKSAEPLFRDAVLSFSISTSLLSFKIKSS